MPLPHIRLNMIVKNEAKVIERCLASIKPWIHSWVIVDTGSTDGTQNIIETFMCDIPGKLIERPWINFGHNRTEALQLAIQSDLPPADYLMFIDADEVLEIEENFKWQELSNSGYFFTCKYDGMQYQRNALVSTKFDWKWVGVLHEYLQCQKPHYWESLKGVNIIIQHDGARGKSADTYLKDIETLKQGLLEEPNNTRYLFYLAQSYRDAGFLKESREFYLKRMISGGWEEERWVAQLYAAKLAVSLEMPHDVIYQELLSCWIQRQQRAEPLYELAKYYRNNKQFDLASYYAKQACEIHYPDQDILFVDQAVYEWAALDELSVSASYCQNYKSAGYEAIQKLVKEHKFPRYEEKRILDNLRWYES